MKFLGTTFFASALALVAACSAGSSEAPRADEAANDTETLLAASRRGPESDPCAAVRCRTGTECVVVDGEATCADTDINPCAAVTCLVGNTCEVIDGEPACVPVDAGACAAVSCLEGNACEVVDGEATCVPVDASACAAVLCGPGTTCEEIDGQGVCTPVEPAGPFCGGFAGIECPGAGACIDDASDECDPNNGGADCGGSCVCPSVGDCERGFVFDESPNVCACVEQEPEVDACAAVRCREGTECVVVDDRAECRPVEASECAAVLCEVGSTCEVIDGAAVCVPSEPNPCAAVLCPVDTVCVVDGDEARCEPAECN